MIGFLGNPWTLNFGLRLHLSLASHLYSSSKKSALDGPPGFVVWQVSGRMPHLPLILQDQTSTSAAFSSSGWAILGLQTLRGGESPTGCLQLRTAPQSHHLLSGDRKRLIVLGRCLFWQLSQPQIGQSCSSVGDDASGCECQGISSPASTPPSGEKRKWSQKKRKP